MQLGQAENADEWNSRIERGLVRISTITRLEVGYSARTGEGGRMIFEVPPLSLMPIERLTPSMEDRAWEVQMVLAEDKDFDLIASVTGQAVETLTLS